MRSMLAHASTVLAQRRRNADRQAADPQAADPQAADPQAADPQAADPQAADPQAADPQAADPQAADPQAADPQAADPQAADPQAADPQAADRLRRGRQAQLRARNPVGHMIPKPGSTDDRRREAPDGCDRRSWPATAGPRPARSGASSVPRWRAAQ
jgi:hypothetical protein